MNAIWLTTNLGPKSKKGKQRATSSSTKRSQTSKSRNMKPKDTAAVKPKVKRQQKGRGGKKKKILID